MKPHDSMRGWFAWSLHQEMRKNKDIVVITGDLGYGMFDTIRSDFEDRFINTGAAEQCMTDIVIGMALQGKIPVVYSITPFLLYRPFEAIRTYINHEKLNVKLIGGGRDKDYEHDGISHWSEDALKLFLFWDGVPEDAILCNIKDRWPKSKEEIPKIVKEMLESKEPYFLSLRR